MCVSFMRHNPLRFCFMQLQLQQVIPVPLREKVLAHTSGIWNAQVVFGPGEWNFGFCPILDECSVSGKCAFGLLHWAYRHVPATLSESYL